MDFDRQKELAAKLGFDIKGVSNDHDFMVSMMNVMAQEWEKRQHRK